MNIVDQFGKRKNGLTLDPAMPAIPRPPAPKTDDSHAASLAYVDGLKTERDRLLTENALLQKNLDVALALGNEFKRLHDLAVADARHWEAYAVEARTCAQNIKDACDRLHAHGKAAQDRAKAETPKVTPEQAATLVAGVEAELIGAKFGPKEDPVP